jgi:hypothetical protein
LFWFKKAEQFFRLLGGRRFTGGQGVRKLLGFLLALALRVIPKLVHRRFGH